MSNRPQNQGCVIPRCTKLFHTHFHLPLGPRRERISNPSTPATSPLTSAGTWSAATSPQRSTFQNQFANPSQAASRQEEMNSRRTGGPRSGQRAGGQDTGEEVDIWNQVKDQTKKLASLASRSQEVTQEIFAKELRMKTAELAGTSNSIILDSILADIQF